MKTLEADKTKTIDRIARTFRPVLADSKGSLPTEIEVLKVGMWETTRHGMFMVTPDDLQQYVTNFDAGVGQAGEGIGVPIDFSHEIEEKAAGWIKKLFIRGETLFGKVEWSTAGEAALKGGEFKCFSPWFYPRSFGGWEDPEQMGYYVENVLAGGALTNIPLFKGLQPIMASAGSGKPNSEDSKNVIYISASAANNQKEKNMPTLQEVLAKNVDALTEEDKTLLSENKDTLTDEQKTKFGFEVTPAATGSGEQPNGGEQPAAGAEKPAEKPADQPAPAGVEASAQKGQVVMAAAEAQMLRDTAKQYQTEKAEQIVDKHIARGAIVASEKASWVGSILASTGEARTNLEGMLDKLPENKVMKEEQGTTGAASDVKASAQVIAAANKLVDTAKAAGNPLDYGSAVKQVLASDADLSSRYASELKDEK